MRSKSMILLAFFPYGFLGRSICKVIEAFLVFWSFLVFGFKLLLVMPLRIKGKDIRKYHSYAAKVVLVFLSFFFVFFFLFCFPSFFINLFRVYWAQDQWAKYWQLQSLTQLLNQSLSEMSTCCILKWPFGTPNCHLLPGVTVRMP